MNNKNVLIGAAAGGVLAGIGFLAFHPEGKKLGKKLAKMGMHLAENVMDIVRTNMSSVAASETAKTTAVKS